MRLYISMRPSRSDWSGGSGRGGGMRRNCLEEKNCKCHWTRSGLWLMIWFETPLVRTKRSAIKSEKCFPEFSLEYPGNELSGAAFEKEKRAKLRSGKRYIPHRGLSQGGLG